MKRKGQEKKRIKTRENLDGGKRESKRKEKRWRGGEETVKLLYSKQREGRLL